jgi:hypothetical protein
MLEQMDPSEEDMEVLRKMIESLAAEVKNEFKLGLSSIEAKLEKTQASVDAMAQAIQSLNSGRSGDIIVDPLQVSSNATELVTSSVGLVEPSAAVPALGEPL